MNKKVITFVSVVVSLLGQSARSGVSEAFDVMAYEQERQIILMQTNGEDRELLIKALTVNNMNELTTEEKIKSLLILEKVKNRLEVESTPYIME